MNSFCARSCPAAMVMMMLVVCSGGIAVSAAPGPQLQPLSARFVPEIGGYAPGYGYGGVVLGPAAGVRAGPAISKTVVQQPPTAVAGYAPSAVYKPDLSAYAAASFPLVEQLRRFNPGFRPVHTVVPKVTDVEPSVTVQKTYADVPVVHEYSPYAVQDPSPYYNYQLIDRK